MKFLKPDSVEGIAADVEVVRWLVPGFRRITVRSEATHTHKTRVTQHATERESDDRGPRSSEKVLHEGGRIALDLGGPVRLGEEDKMTNASVNW